MRSYAYFWGCYIPGRLPHLEKATRAVLAALGVDCQDVADLTCCPEKTMIRNMDYDTWLLTAARNLAVAEEAGRTFVTPCTGCFSTLKEAQVKLHAQPALAASVNQALARVNRSYYGVAEAIHILDLLWSDFGPGGLKNRLLYPLTGLRVAVHYGCHLLRPSGALHFDDPFWPRKLDDLVTALGAESVPYPSKMECCGNLLLRAGSEETASAMCRSKLTDVTNAGAEAIVVVCPSCMMQYDNVQYGLQREGESLHVPVFYYPQLLGLALGLAPEEVGLDRHRVTVTPFLQRWEERRESFDHIREHWDLRLLQACADCGACVDDCPVARNNTSYNPNELIRALAQGKLDEVLTSPVLWQCVECYTCAEMCPNKYDQMTILRKAKTLALRAGQAPQSALEGIRAFQQSGQLTQASVAQRKRLGLPAPPTAAIAELQTLLQQGEETQSHV